MMAAPLFVIAAFLCAFAMYISATAFLLIHGRFNADLRRASLASAASAALSMVAIALSVPLWRATLTSNSAAAVESPIALEFRMVALVPVLLEGSALLASVAMYIRARRRFAQTSNPAN
jgi:hypothetical protein